MQQTVPENVIDAFMALLGEKPFEAIDLPEIAERAGLTLGALREAADGKFAILAAFMRRIDRAVLDEADKAGEDTRRDRLFDILMRRFDKLVTHKRAVAHLAASARRDPALALGLNALALPSARYMLAAAGIGTDGLRGCARTQGLVTMLVRLMPTWIDDTDPDQSRTMAALDKALSRAEGWDHRVGRIEKAVCRIGRRFERRRPSPSPAGATDTTDAAA
ncbi:TetR/AcrR family transcriptional regulator [Mesorhizobium sp. BR1-1-16]|uniref:TetR/AcrR family transcriptional regulator n=1 Tax=Mesorhizobium sp. BR1-1-16 TaxID=2876653 RepID=UPI001CCB50B9|nr:TetR/AcrR family transcriptional regulator [Mesorhizobium sp. BR1-1-16]MBZ9936426.1 TetR/AcrR family transcriptional regulator [Mesorhizobium sp. BR1-1-16]